MSTPVGRTNAAMGILPMATVRFVLSKNAHDVCPILQGKPFFDGIKSMKKAKSTYDKYISLL